MSDYWGIPEQEYDLSLLQFAQGKLSEMGYAVLSEKVEVCSGAGALTMTAVLKTRDVHFSLYLHDGPKQRKSRGPPVIRILKLLRGMNSAEDVRSFVLAHQHDFCGILSPEDSPFKERTEADLRRVYAFLYRSKIKDLYDNDISSAADILRKRLRKKDT